MDQEFFPLWQDARNHPDKYVDEVAVERALKGDASVLQAMTPPERYALLNAVCRQYDPRDRVATKRPGSYPIHHNRLLLELSEAWGMDYQYLADKVHNRQRRKVEAAYRKRRRVA